MACLDLATRRFEVHDFGDDVSVSNSLIIFTKNNEKEDVVFKLSVGMKRDSPDNSLEVEREMYAVMLRNVARLTPHVLLPLKIGKCKDTWIASLEDESRANSQKRALFNGWVKLRELAIEDQVKHEGQTFKSLIRKYESSDSELSFGSYLLNEDPVWSKRFREAAYVQTPRLKGETLRAFFEKRKNKIPLKTLRSIALQLAQLFSAFDILKIIHNDPHDLNIWIEECKTCQDIPYKFPRNAIHRTRVKVTVFDLDRAYRRGTLVNKDLLKGSGVYCKRFGQCAEFVPKKDWYLVVTHLIEATQNKEFEKEMRAVLGGQFRPRLDHEGRRKVGDDAEFGHACECLKLGRAGNCLLCKVRDLSKMETPEAYFIKHITQQENESDDE